MTNNDAQDSEYKTLDTTIGSMGIHVEVTGDNVGGNGTVSQITFAPTQSFQTTGDLADGPVTLEFYGSIEREDMAQALRYAASALEVISGKSEATYRADLVRRFGHLVKDHELNSPQWASTNGTMHEVLAALQFPAPEGSYMESSEFDELRQAASELAAATERFDRASIKVSSIAKPAADR